MFYFTCDCSFRRPRHDVYWEAAADLGFAKDVERTTASTKREPIMGVLRVEPRAGSRGRALKMKACLFSYKRGAKS